MRIRSLTIGAMTMAATASVLTACWPVNLLDDCEENVALRCFWEQRASAAGGAGTGGDGGTPPGCVPSANDQPVADNCGVFVSSMKGNDSNDGTKESPVATLAKAVELAAKGSRRVYACAETFDAALVLDVAVEVYGGLECSNEWRHGEARTTLTAKADEIPFVMKSGADGVRIEDFEIHAKDAMKEGGSSIAVLADGAVAEFVRCEFVAGTGRDGEKGETPSEPVGPMDPNDPGIKGAAGAAACMGPMSGNPGGVGAINPLCNMSRGGDGGKGTEASGDDGSDGKPVPNPNPNGKGLGGIGDIGNGCESGEDGQLGAVGVSGAGASELGMISATGYIGVPGQDGLAGGLGQGGGGGGGAKGKPGCNGASGGGGGAGGCGGGGGTRGKAGGSSIALISLNATLLFNEVRLVASDGGRGGEGGDGQAGGTGGVGGLGGLGMGTLNACAGGQGGQGGFGGKGGGGRGGHSIGIAYVGEALSTDGVTFALGTPGLGGLGADEAGNGMDGVNGDTQEFM